MIIVQGMNSVTSQRKIIGEVAKSVNITEEQITQHIVKKFGLSEEEAKKKIKEVSDYQVGGN